jgi:aryl-alcohol dehydrogenase-like predicted oxidoreductase
VRYTDWPELGRQVSAFALGSVDFGTGMSDAAAFEVMDAYIEMGGNVIDTARVYGDFDRGILGTSERTIGHWLSARRARHKVILSTKGAHPPWTDMKKARLDKGSIQSDLDASLQALGVDCIEMYYLHRDDESRPVGDIVDTINGLVESGRVKMLGASNWKTARIEEANAYAAAHGLRGFSLNQPQWSLAFQHHVGDATLVQMDRAMYAMHRRTGLICMPYSSQAKGFFIKLFEGGEAGMKASLRQDFLSDDNLRRYEAVLRVREESGLSVGAISLAYLTNQQDFRTLPIVGVSRLSQIDALREAADARISRDQMRALVEVAGLSG